MEFHNKMWFAYILVIAVTAVFIIYGVLLVSLKVVPEKCTAVRTDFATEHNREEIQSL